MDIQHHYNYDILYPQSRSIFKNVNPYIGEMQHGVHQMEVDPWWLSIEILIPQEVQMPSDL